MRRGRVTEFDEAVGLGTVTAADDGAEFRFHMIEIADGTRTIEVGTDVTFVELPRLGAMQAASLHPV